MRKDKTSIKRRPRINVENPQCGKKTTAAHRLQKYTMREDYSNGSTRATTSCTPCLRHTWRLQWRQLSLSHTLSHAVSIHTRCTTTNYLTTHILCPKSYLYIYDFRVIYMFVLSNWSDRSVPVLGSTGSLCLPSGGTCFLP